tara:strand:+ start:1465 stop:1650 length:186 start_codon:yes stop_codon:yes gene_type:complete
MARGVNGKVDLDYDVCELFFVFLVNLYVIFSSLFGECGMNYNRGAIEFIVPKISALSVTND